MNYHSILIKSGETVDQYIKAYIKHTQFFINQWFGLRNVNLILHTFQLQGSRALPLKFLFHRQINCCLCSLAQRVLFADR